MLVDSSNAGRAWLHYWIDEDNNFRYGIIQPDQITPVYATTLDNKLFGVLRSYKQLDPDTGKYQFTNTGLIKKRNFQDSN